MSVYYAGSFDGSSSYLNLASSNIDVSGGSWWWNAWLYPTSYPSASVIVNIDGITSDRQFGLWRNGATGTLTLYAFQTGAATITGPDIPTNQWSMLTIWYDVSDSKLRIAVNGSTTTTESGTSSFSSVTSPNLQIGWRDASYFYQGLMDGMSMGKGYAPVSGDLTWLYNGGTGRSLSDWPSGAASLYSSAILYLTFDDSGNLGLDSLALNSLTNNGVTRSTSGIVDQAAVISSGTASASGSGTAFGSGTEAITTSGIGDTFAPILILKRRASSNIIVPSASGHAIVSGVSVSQPWNPSMLTDLVAWYKADDGLFTDAGITPCTDGTAVYQWNDFSSNHYNLTQTTLANRPTFRTNQIAPSNLPAVVFGGSHGVSTTSMPRLLNFTVAIIWIDDSSVSNYRVPVGHQNGADSTRNFCVYLMPSSESLHFSIVGAGDLYLEDVTLSATTVHIYSYDHSNMVFYDVINPGNNKSTAATGDPADPLGEFTLGALNSALAYPLSGRIAEVVVFSDALIGGDLSNLSSYLVSRLQQINPATASDTGSGSASAVGRSLDIATASVSGTALTSGIGAPYELVTASASGSASADGSGRSIALNSGSASDGGFGSASAVGGSLDLATCSDSGNGSVIGYGQSSAIATASASGSTTTSVVGAGFSISTASDSGSGSANGVGASRNIATASASGSESASAVGISSALAMASDSGIGSASGVGQSNAIVTASASGSASASGTGMSVAQNTSFATDGGLGVASGVGGSLDLVTASGSGVGSSSGTGGSLDLATASASGLATVSGQELTYLIATGTGSASGNSLDIGSGKEFATVTASDSGNATAISYGVWFETFAVSASGLATATGSGELAFASVANDVGLGSAFGAGIGPSAASDGGLSVAGGVGHSLYLVIASAHGSALVAGYDANWHGSGWLGADFNLF